MLWICFCWSFFFFPSFISSYDLMANLLCFHSFFFSVYLLYFFCPFFFPPKQGFVRAPAGGSENNQQVPLLTPQASLFLIWKEGRSVSRVWATGMAQVFCSPLRWWCMQGSWVVSCFCSGFFRSHSYISWHLCVFLIQNFP